MPTGPAAAGQGLPQTSCRWVTQQQEPHAQSHNSFMAPLNARGTPGDGSQCDLTDPLNARGTPQEPASPGPAQDLALWSLASLGRVVDVGAS